MLQLFVCVNAEATVSTGGEKEGYFYCKRGRKYRNSVRPNRVTGSGFWKATGIDKPVYSHGGEGHECVGLKKTLVYYRGSAGKGTKTDWMMHEFRLPPNGKITSKNPHANDSNDVQEAVSDQIMYMFILVLLMFLHYYQCVFESMLSELILRKLNSKSKLKAIHI